MTVTRHIVALLSRRSFQFKQRFVVQLANCRVGAEVEAEEEEGEAALIAIVDSSFPSQLPRSLRFTFHLISAPRSLISRVRTEESQNLPRGGGGIKSDFCVWDTFVFQL